MTSIPTVIPICLNSLPLYVVHALYTMVLDNPVAMVSIEMNPAVQDVPLVHHYVCLFHHYARMHIDLSIAVTFSPMSFQQQMDRLTIKRLEILQLLISTIWGRFFHGSIPDDLLNSLLQTTLSLLQPMEWDHYFSLDGPEVPTPPRSPTTLSSEVPSSSSLPPSRNLAGFGQRLSNFVSSFSPIQQDHHSAFSTLSSDIATLHHHFPPGRALRCAQCGSIAHFHQDCPTYTCSGCMVSSLDHAHHACPALAASPGSTTAGDGSSESS